MLARKPGDEGGGGSGGGARSCSGPLFYFPAGLLESQELREGGEGAGKGRGVRFRGPAFILCRLARKPGAEGGRGGGGARSCSGPLFFLLSAGLLGSQELREGGAEEGPRDGRARHGLWLYTVGSDATASWGVGGGSAQRETAGCPLVREEAFIFIAGRVAWALLGLDLGELRAAHKIERDYWILAFSVEQLG